MQECNSFRLKSKSVTEAFRSQVLGVVRDVMIQSGRQLYEWKVCRTDGEIREVLFNKATWTDANGRVEGLVGTILDLTERNRVEAKVQELNRTLEQRIQKRAKSCISPSNG